MQIARQNESRGASMLAMAYQPPTRHIQSLVAKILSDLKSTEELLHLIHTPGQDMFSSER
jgi:hypothetical protein